VREGALPTLRPPVGGSEESKQKVTPGAWRLGIVQSSGRSAIFSRLPRERIEERQSTL